MSRLHTEANLFFVVGIVAIALAGLFTIWYGSNHHPAHNVPTLVEADQ